MPNVRGRAIAVRGDFVRERFGSEAWTAIQRRLPAALRALVAQPLDPAGWYPMELYDAVQRAIGEAHGTAGGALYEEMGAFSAERNAAPLYGAPGRDPFDFFKHAAELHAQLFDFGEMTVVQRPGGCMIELDYAGHASEAVCRDRGISRAAAKTRPLPRGDV